MTVLKVSAVWLVAVVFLTVAVSVFGVTLAEAVVIAVVVATSALSLAAYAERRT